MARLYDWGKDVGYAALCAAAVLGCMLVTTEDLRADTGQSCQDQCAAQGLTGQNYGICVTQCCTNDPSACAVTSCGGGNPACAQYVTSGDCFPGAPDDTSHQNNCNGNANCHCRWRPVSGVDKCVCQNTTGN